MREFLKRIWKDFKQAKWYGKILIFFALIFAFIVGGTAVCGMWVVASTRDLLDDLHSGFWYRWHKYFNNG